MKYLKLFENYDDIYEVVFLPSGEILKFTTDMIWGNHLRSDEIEDYDITWSQGLDMYVSKDEHLDEIYEKIRKYENK